MNSDLQSLIETIDAEQDRLARTLHDTVCQSVQGAELLWRVIERKLEAEAPGLLADATALTSAIRSAADQLQQIILDLAAPGMDAGLVLSLASLAEEASKSIPCEFLCEDPVEIPNYFINRQLVRIASGMLECAIRSQSITSMTLSLERGDDEITLSLSQVGPVQIPGSQRRLLDLRTLAIGAHMTFRSANDRKNIIACKLPYSL